MKKPKARDKAPVKVKDRRPPNLKPIPFGAAGLPAKDSVTRRERFRSPQGVEYEILKTSERDAYDRARRRGRKTSR